MPPRAAPAAEVGQQGQQRQGGGLIGGLLRMAVTYYMFSNFMGGKKQQNVPRDQMLVPRFQQGQRFDIDIYVSEQLIFLKEDFGNQSKLIWSISDVELAGTGLDKTLVFDYKTSEEVQNNGTLYLHAFFTRPGFSPDPSSLKFDISEFFHKIHPMVVYLPERKKESGVNLLGTIGDNKTTVTSEPEEPRKIVSYLKPNITIALVDSFAAYPEKQVPPYVKPFLDVDPFATPKEYTPIVFFNDFWMLREYLIPMNETVKETKLHIFLHTLANWKWQLYMQMDQSFNMQQGMGLTKEGEEDEFKRILLEGNPFFLGLTIIVSLLHSVFDIFAFKSDIGFWKNKDNLTGLSVRTILINSFNSVVIFLYLLDNETSFVVLASNFVGMLIEFWKITKAMDVSVTWNGSIPKISFKDRASYTESKTKQYDDEAMWYLSYALFPLVFCYAIYTLLYEKHKSWYSWVISTLVGAVYTFGFILMCPQLYLNYRLKSVAHMPWRQMTFKFLNTIIDDLFAFVIKMPWLHRLSVFRDDIIFVMFLYQRWIYPVDKTRANEFGYAEVPEPGAVEGPTEATNGTLLEDTPAESKGSLQQRKKADANGEASDSPPPLSSPQDTTEEIQELKKDK